MHIMNFRIIFSRILKIISLLLLPTKSSSLVAQRLKHLPPMQEARVWSLGWEDPLEKEMVTHPSILAWRIPWTEKPGRLPSMGSQRVRHDWATSLSLSLVAQMLKGLLTVQDTWARSLGWEDPLEKEMANHSSTLAWEISWTEEPGGLHGVANELDMT